MAKFNQKIQPVKPNTPNLAGGQAYTMSAEKEILTILLTSFLNDKFYEKATDTMARLKGLLQSTNMPEKAAWRIAKIIVYARTVFGMRSITHIAAAEFARQISGYAWAKSFFEKVIRRPDDMTEIWAYMKTNGHKMPAAMKKGFAKAFNKFGAYNLAKYRGEGKSVKLVDIANLVHPQPIRDDKYDDLYFPLSKLMKGELKQTETWESLLSEATTSATKEAVWTKLIDEKKLGYLALLRNLRNIIQQAPEALRKALDSLTTPAFINKSLIMPFQYMTAMQEMEKLTGPDSQRARWAMIALSKAIDLSLANVPVFPGSTLVVLDVSSSMLSRATVNGNQKVSDIGALFAAVIIKSNNTDFMTFSDDANYVNMNLMDTTSTIARQIYFRSGGTNFISIFQRANKKYDRIIILSDMQEWLESQYEKGTDVKEEQKKYNIKYKANPYIYSFDLAGYGTLQFHENKTFLMGGFSNKVFDMMKYMEKDKDAWLNSIMETITL